MAESEKHFELAVGIAVEGLKALVLVNAGAAGVLIALTDKAPQLHDYTCAVLCFGGGAIVAVLAMVFSYFSQLSYANHVFERENGNDTKANCQHTRHIRANYGAIILVCFSLVLAVAGAFSAFTAAHISP